MAQRLVKIGLYIYAVLKRLRDDAPGYDLLHRVFHDQYVVAKVHADLIQVEMLQATVDGIVEP